MTPLDATKRLQLVVTDPLPSAACELCPAPCADGETCFCDIGSELLSRGIRKFKKQWPAMSNERAGLLVAETVLNCVTADPGAETDNVSEMLLSQVVALAFQTRAGFRSDADARGRAEIAARERLKQVLRELTAAVA